MPKASKGGPSVMDKQVLAYVHHLLKYKGLNASAKALENEARLSKESLGSYSPGIAAQLWFCLSTTKGSKPEPDSDSDSDDESSSDEDDSVMSTVFFLANN
jgi:hypothetical protein